MRFSSPALIGLLLASAAHAQLTLTGAGTNGSGILVPQFYVASPAHGGSDSNPGTLASPWATGAKVNTSATAGSQVNFYGGDTFTTTAAITADVSITSYNTGQATISSGNSAACISNTNPAGPRTISNIICTGGGNLTNTTDGIVFINSQTGNTKLSGPTISNVTVSGYGANCLEIEGTSGHSGFIGGVISNFTGHDCTGNDVTSGGSAGIMIHASTDYGSGSTTPAHTNFSLSNILLYNITGTANAGNWTGSGIFLGQTSNSTVDESVVHDFGNASNFASSGPGGIWTSDSINITLRRSEVYNGAHASGGTDGGGFDCDGGTVNCVVELDYSHDNQGWDYLLDNYSDGTCCSNWGGNIIRWSIGQNSMQGELQLTITNATTSAAIVHNNTFINQRANPLIFSGGEGPTPGTNTITFANNIFVQFGGAANIMTLPNGDTTGRNFYGNDYYTYGQPIAFDWNGTSYSSFASWQTATGQEKLAGNNVGIISNPEIYVPGGGWINGGYVPANLYAYNLQSGSPLVGVGLDTQTNWGFAPGSTDYYGNAISATSLPVGAAAGDFGTFVASCTAITNYLGRTTGFTKADDVNYNSLLCGEASDGDFALLDTQWMLAAPNSAAAVLNTVSNSLSLTAVGGVTFTARAGVKFDGTTGYYSTGYIPSSSGVNYTLNSASLGAYDFSATGTAATYAIGGVDTTSSFDSSLVPWTTGNTVYGDMNSNVNTGTGVTGGATTPAGITVVLRTGASALALYKDGTSLATSTDASLGVVNNPFCVGGYYRESILACGHLIADTLGSVFIGGGGINAANISRRHNSFMAAYGVNQY